jgi:hypothetical protein
LTVLAFTLPENDPTATTAPVAPSLFVVPKPVFDYATFRAEFVRLKQQTSYQRANAQAEVMKQSRTVECVDGVPVWAHAAHCERWYDDSGHIHVSPSPLKELTVNGVFAEHSTYPCERYAVADLEEQADLWIGNHGRVLLNDIEHAAVMEARRFLQSFQNQSLPKGKTRTVAAAFASQYAEWMKSLGESAKLAAHHVEAFVGFRLNMPPEKARYILDTADRIVELRAALGYTNVFAKGYAVPTIAVPVEPEALPAAA